MKCSGTHFMTDELSSRVEGQLDTIIFLYTLKPPSVLTTSVAVEVLSVHTCIPVPVRQWWSVSHQTQSCFGKRFFSSDWGEVVFD